MYRTNDAAYYYRYGGTVDGFNRFFPEVLTLSDIRFELLDQYKCEGAREYLFEEYVACFYYHAQQLLEYRQTDKNGVMCYFKNEMESRKLVPALEDFFFKNGNQSKGIKLILEHDYEGMYHYANELMQKHKRSWKYMAKQCLDTFFRHASDVMRFIKRDINLQAFIM